MVDAKDEEEEEEEEEESRISQPERDAMQHRPESIDRPYLLLLYIPYLFYSVK